jgi:flagellar biosynthesis protein FlhG
MSETARSQRRQRAVTVAVTSGKGGVGKTSIVVNLSVALARLRHRVAVLDADFGLANVDVLLGLAPSAHLGDLLAGEKGIADIMVPGPAGVQIIPASSGMRELTVLTPGQWQRLTRALNTVCSEVDFLLIDTAAGISDNVIRLLLAAQFVLVVTSFEPTAIVDAYALIKVLTVSDARKDIGVLVNGTRDGEEAEVVFRQLDVAAGRFLHHRLHYYGFVPQDPGFRESVLAQRSIVDYRPQSEASRCFRVLASRIAGLAPTRGPGLRLVRPRGDDDPTPLGGGPTDGEVEQCA